ncbi:alpha/beta hydrolase [Streptomyces antibioticus]|uniref:alpha/beta hydrolase n=1 Tax=Streptomyces antibioticus TaxID=1890 RepID=UPI0034117082
MSSLIASASTGRARRVRRGRFAACSLLLVTAMLGATDAHARAGDPARPGDSGATITAVREIDARTRDLTVSSSAMRQSIPVRVILPKNWATHRQATFPVLYMLHGGDDDYTSWTRETDVEALAENSDVLVVMPDGGRAGYYTDWKAGGPRWETFHTRELVRLMEESYRASSSRAIVGLSMGGFGALNYAAHHRGMFRYAASMSSYVDLNDGAARLALALGADREGTDLRKVWGDPDADARIWRAHSPAAMPAAFRGTKVHLSAGDGTPGPLDRAHTLDVVFVGALAESALPRSMKKFAAALRSSGVETTTHFYRPGTHSWPYWNRELHTLWPAVQRALK